MKQLSTRNSQQRAATSMYELDCTKMELARQYQKWRCLPLLIFLPLNATCKISPESAFHADVLPARCVKMGATTIPNIHTYISKSEFWNKAMKQLKVKKREEGDFILWSGDDGEPLHPTRIGNLGHYKEPRHNEALPAVMVVSRTFLRSTPTTWTRSLPLTVYVTWRAESHENPGELAQKLN